MKIELSTLKDGGVLLVNDGAVKDILKRIEFYRDQRLMMLVYHDEQIQSDLIEYQVPDNMVQTVDQSPDVIVYTMFENHDPIGYKVPLVKVGELY